MILDRETRLLLDEIAESIRMAGFNPYEQIFGFLRTGNERYITRTGNAREMIRQIDRKTLKQYASYLKEKE